MYMKMDDLTLHIVSEPIPNYVLHCISHHWVSVFVYLLVNQLRFQFSKRSIADIIKPMVKSKHMLDCCICSSTIKLIYQIKVNKTINAQEFLRGAISFAAFRHITMAAISLGLSISLRRNSNIQ